MTNVSSGYSSIEIVDYQVSVNLPVTKENGDECVFFWENDKIIQQVDMLDSKFITAELVAGNLN